ncbi:MAG: ABC transporter ATP-binding protein [Thermoplasmata archaeon]
MRGPNDNPHLVFHSTTKRFEPWGRAAVENLSLTVLPGEVVGLVGLNGAGKTTAIRMSVGLCMPTSGTIQVCGFDVSREKVRASQHTGVVPEFPNLDPGARALSLLRYFAGYHRSTSSSTQSRCLRLLEKVGLGGDSALRVRAYSQGMKKRLALAIALLGEPELLLFDEILNGLDPQGVAMVRHMIRDWRDEGRSILLSSHQLSEVELLADRVAIMHHGRLVRTLSQADLGESSPSILRISVLNLDDDGMAYLSTVGEVRRNGGVVTISKPRHGADEINSELVKRGYRVKNLTTDASALESQFLRILEEAEAEEDLPS